MGGNFVSEGIVKFLSVDSTSGMFIMSYHAHLRGYVA